MIALTEVRARTGSGGRQHRTEPAQVEPNRFGISGHLSERRLDPLAYPIAGVHRRDRLGKILRRNLFNRVTLRPLLAQKRRESPLQILQPGIKPTRVMVAIASSRFASGMMCLAESSAMWPCQRFIPGRSGSGRCAVSAVGKPHSSGVRTPAVAAPGSARSAARASSRLAEPSSPAWPALGSPPSA